MVLKHVEIIYHIVLELGVNFSVSGKKKVFNNYPIIIGASWCMMCIYYISLIPVMNAGYSTTLFQKYRFLKKKLNHSAMLPEVVLHYYHAHVLYYNYQHVLKVSSLPYAMLYLW